MKMHPLFYSVFESLPRQGPGDDRSTANAFYLLRDLPEKPRILDLGCGRGRQTLALADLSDGRITAVDNHPPFIGMLKKEYAEGKYPARLEAVVGDMGCLDYPDASFDVIWCEGAVFAIGLKNALKSWRRLLSPGGYLVVSELVWFSADPPKEARDYFAQEYPAMLHYDAVSSLIRSSGYDLINSFKLPEESWRKNFYEPMADVIDRIESSRVLDDEERAVIKGLRKEIDIYERFRECFGYGFYVARRRD